MPKRTCIILNVSSEDLLKDLSKTLLEHGHNIHDAIVVEAGDLNPNLLRALREHSRFEADVFKARERPSLVLEQPLVLPPPTAKKRKGK
jgi:hypothetical protein